MGDKRGGRRLRPDSLEKSLLAEEVRKKRSKRDEDKFKVKRLESRMLYGSEQRRLQRGAIRAVREGSKAYAGTSSAGAADASKGGRERGGMPFFDFKTALAEEETQKDETDTRQRFVLAAQASDGVPSTSSSSSQERDTGSTVTVYLPYISAEEEDDEETEHDVSSSRIDATLIRHEREARRNAEAQQRAEAVIGIHANDDEMKDEDLIKVRPIIWRGRKRINGGSSFACNV